MKKYSFLSAILVAAGVVMSSSAFSPAKAASLSFNIEEFTGSNTEVKVTLDDAIAGLNTVQFKVEVDPTNTKNIGDILGIFFNIKNDSLISSLSLTPVTPFSFKLDKSGSTTDGINDLTNAANLNGGGIQRSFDVGVQIGQQGLKGGKDDYQSVTFNLSANGLDLNQFTAQDFGVRLQSVGAVGSKQREGSSKLAGTVPVPSKEVSKGVQEVPEPSTTAALSLFALSSLTILKKKRVI